ncbi:MAG: hypothetical protein ACKVW3_01680 [Phycisphaerales bacterium]
MFQRSLAVAVAVAVAVAAAVTIAAALVALAAGCSSSRPKIADSAYAGPRIELRTPARASSGAVAVERGGRKHVVIVLAPSSGWAVGFDREDRAFDRTDIYITLRRPNPAELQTQAIVTQEIATPADATRPARVYARVLDFDAPARSQPYELAVP